MDKKEFQQVPFPASNNFFYLRLGIFCCLYSSILLFYSYLGREVRSIWFLANYLLCLAYIVYAVCSKIMAISLSKEN